MKRFLIVEDDELSCKILENCLSEFSECDTAANGRAGYELFEKAILDGQPYDIICSDVDMPVLDGHTMVGLIRAREKTLPIIDCLRTTIFMISSSGSPADMTQAILDNDCDDYIVKPFHRETLEALLRKYNLLDSDSAPEPKK
jgi:two-component system chemotaxis response regulator CheY